MPRALSATIFGALLALWLLSASLFIVYPWEQALVLQFGEVVATRDKPNLYFKLPWQNLRRFETRVLTIDTKDPDRFITKEKENVLVDSFIKWRITNADHYYTSVGGREASATGRLLEIINRGLRDEIGKRTVKEVVSGERDDVMRVMRERANADAGDIGIEVVDVRIKRVELPKAVSENVYNNMIEERRRIANERRATGDAEKEKIRAAADRERTILLAEALSDSEKIRGEGESEAAEIYAGAYQKYPSFYAFHRSLAAYRKSLGTGGDLFVLTPEGDFFEFLKAEGGFDFAADNE